MVSISGIVYILRNKVGIYTHRMNKELEQLTVVSIVRIEIECRIVTKLCLGISLNSFTLSIPNLSDKETRYDLESDVTPLNKILIVNTFMAGIKRSISFDNN